MVNLHISAVNSMTQQLPFLQMSTFSVQNAMKVHGEAYASFRMHDLTFTKRRIIGDFTVETLVLI